MTNQIPPALVDEFERELIEYGKRASVVQPTNGHSFALGYVFSMLKAGTLNEAELKYRIQKMKEYSFSDAPNSNATLERSAVTG